MAEALSEDVHGDLALSFILDTDVNVFLTGSAGTGKTTLLKEVLKKSNKNVVVVAPTGVAAINAGGVTIHSFFSLPHKAFIPSNQFIVDPDLFTTPKSLSSSQKLHQDRRDTINELDLLVIDEISMVRADLLDEIDFTLRRVRRINSPFGGVQVLAIGDLLQLAPISKPNIESVLQEFYPSPYFYESIAWKRASKVVVQLHKIYRQTDRTFIDILNKIRVGKSNQQDVDYINNGYTEEVDLSDTITLTTHNYKANRINSEQLSNLKSKSHQLEATIEGNFYESAFPIPKEFEIKKGAQVMFVKNDPEQRYFNGKIGTITKISKETIYVKCKDDKKTIEVEPVEWSNDKYTVDPESDKIIKENIGKFIQYPLKLAWAVTVHKSQGLTFDKVVIDLKDTFATGQLYVALSRCRSLEGIALLSKISLYNIKVDQRIIQYNEEQVIDSNIEERLQLAKEQYDNSCFLKALQLNKLKSHHLLWQPLIMDLESDDIEEAVTIREEFSNEWQRLSTEMAINIEKLSLLLQPETKDKESKINALLDEIKEGPIASIRKETRRAIKDHLSKSDSEGWRYKKFLKDYLRKIEKYYKGAERLTYPFSKTIRNSEESQKPVTSQIIKAPKASTQQITLDLWRVGMSFEEIAKERGFVKSTIEGHMAYWLEKREIGILALMNKKRLKYLEKHILKDFDGLHSELKQTIPKDISFGEIKWLAAYRSEDSDL
ncbi:MAG: hypothetical protein ACI9FN_000740 [Saprospiraceae bacterium]|jgi:hypothetical protein